MRKFLIILFSSFSLTACGQTQNTNQTTNKKSERAKNLPAKILPILWKDSIFHYNEAASEFC